MVLSPSKMPKKKKLIKLIGKVNDCTPKNKALVKVTILESL